MERMGKPRPATVVVETVGDNAISIRRDGSAANEPDASAVHWLQGMAERLRLEWPDGMVDVIVAPDRVTLLYDPLSSDGGGDTGTVNGRLVAEVRRIVEACEEPGLAMTIHRSLPIEIPVRYGGDEGPDLDHVCATCGVDRATFIRLHTSPEYHVSATGFVPGFAYLAGLLPTLAAPRRSTPRVRVPAGSVGIGGNQTGVYPFATPGGWQIVGRTDVVLFDPHRVPAATLRLGDRVRFVESSGGQAAGAASCSAVPAKLVLSSADAGGRFEAVGWLTILTPGLHTTIQDLGRRGHRSEGVPIAGAIDPSALRLANLAVGNPENTAAIECTLLGPTIRFDRTATVAIVGASFPGLPTGQPFRVAAGQALALGHATQGCRGYLAIAGGVGVEPVMGSRSTYVPAGFGGFDGRPLVAGDRVPLAAATKSVSIGPWSLDPRLCQLPAGETVLRMVPARDDRPSEVVRHVWRVTTRSDRMGLRLARVATDDEHDSSRWPSRLRPAVTTGARVSVAVMPGTVQMPPDGDPIVLMADAQTIGGYPVVGQVIAADLPMAARLRPGDAVRLEPVGIASAHAALREHERAFDVLRRGLAPLLGRLPSIDLNCDVGEGGAFDESIMPLVSSVNIACGWHAGGVELLRRTVALARWHGVAVGAHPGHADREGFGRRERSITPAEAADLVASQIATVEGVAGQYLRHVKLHGGLYHQVGRDDRLSHAVAERLAREWKDLIVYAAAASSFAAIARNKGLAVAEEAFVDRGYDARGNLLPRSAVGGLISDAETAAAQAEAIVCTGRVTTESGATIDLRADTLCVHGDGPNPVACLLATRRTLAAAGIAIDSPAVSLRS